MMFDDFQSITVVLDLNREFGALLTRRSDTCQCVIVYFAHTQQDTGILSNTLRFNSSPYDAAPQQRLNMNRACRHHNGLSKKRLFSTRIVPSGSLLFMGSDGRLRANVNFTIFFDGVVLVTIKIDCTFQIHDICNKSATTIQLHSSVGLTTSNLGVTSQKPVPSQSCF